MGLVAPSDNEQPREVSYRPLGKHQGQVNTQSIKASMSLVAQSDAGAKLREMAGAKWVQANMNKRAQSATAATTRRKIRVLARSVTTLGAKITRHRDLETIALLIQSMTTTKLGLGHPRGNNPRIRRWVLVNTNPKKWTLTARALSR